MQGSGKIRCGHNEWAGAVGEGNDRYWDFVNSFYYFGLQHLLKRACGHRTTRFQQQDAVRFSLARTLWWVLRIV